MKDNRILVAILFLMFLLHVPGIVPASETGGVTEQGYLRSGALWMVGSLAGLEGLLSIWLGISLRRRRKLAESRGKALNTLNAILQGIEDPIFMVDKDLNIIWGNDTVKNLIGENAFGRKCYEVLHGRSKPCNPQPCLTVQSFFDGQPRHGERRVISNGVTRYFLCSSKVALTDAEGRATAVVETSREITAMRKAQQELHLAKMANDSSINPIGMADLQGRLTYVNQACLDLWGFSTREEILGKELFQFVRNPLNALAVIEELRSKGGWRGILAGRKKDGTLFDVEAHAYLTRNPEGEPVCLTAYFADVTEKKRTEQQISRLAYYDALTGLPNRILLADQLEQAIGHARRSQESLAVLLLDLDNFKQVNDSLGHAKGDAVIQAVAARLNSRVRRGDTFSRWAGDEFVFILANTRMEEDAATFAKLILEQLTEQSFKLNERQFFVTGSIGIAMYPRDGQDVDTLLQHADTAMYEAKRTGGNSHHFFSENLHQKIIERHTLEGSLRQALREDQFSLVYQPQVDLECGRIVGMEALVRWQHPDKGVISPAQFIPIAEETGMIRPLGNWILRTACSHASQWQQLGNGPCRVAVNISACQFQQPDLVDQIEEVLQETGLDPQLLELELTESVFMENLDQAIEVLVDLKARGIKIAIDDFGTGYSSLSYLKNFPIDRLKIAQVFVRDVMADPNDRAIVEATIAMAKSLRLQIIAEGVESREQMEFLRSLDCREMQGYYFARPMDVQQIVELIGRDMVLPEWNQGEKRKKCIHCSFGC
ncbi:MAG: EAL domain-containing protein [Syntrophotaleaceae bacterium]